MTAPVIEGEPFILRSPIAHNLLSQSASEKLQEIYMESVRDIVQYNSECARYDQDIFYTLRPGKCIFKNAEFVSTLQINSLGFRDNEEVLKSPEIVIIGDSFAMGWGVNQQETFAYILGERTGQRVLNTGVSSYGTVREKMAMSRVSLEKMKYLIIQYCPNDKRENQFFYLQKNVHKNQTQEQFDYLVNWLRSNRQYYPGKNLDLIASQRFFGTLFMHEFKNFISDEKWDNEDQKALNEMPGKEEAELFINALVNAGVPLPRSLKKIIVFSVDSYNSQDQRMIKGLEKLKSEHRLDQISAEFIIVDASKFLTQKEYYKIDDHLRPEGHKAIADAVMVAIEN